MAPGDPAAGTESVTLHSHCRIPLSMLRGHPCLPQEPRGMEKWMLG